MEAYFCHGIKNKYILREKVSQLPFFIPLWKQVSIKSKHCLFSACQIYAGLLGYVSELLYRFNWTRPMSINQIAPVGGVFSARGSDWLSCQSSAEIFDVYFTYNSGI